VQEAAESVYALPSCVALFWLTLNLHLTGTDQEAAEDAARRLADRAGGHGLETHRALGICLIGLGEERRGRSAQGEARLIEGLEGLAQARYGPFDPYLVAELAALRIRAGWKRA
jgi:hypothetical protein